MMLTQRLGVLAHDFAKQCHVSSSISRAEEKARESRSASITEFYHTNRSEWLVNNLWKMYLHYQTIIHLVIFYLISVVIWCLYPNAISWLFENECDKSIIFIVT